MSVGAQIGGAMAVFDHLAIAAESLSAGVAWTETALGVPLEPGGVHPLMGTHNALLSLGPTAYLEVIAINPAIEAPVHPRWFALNDFGGAPRLRAWILRVDDLDAALALAPPGAGRPVALSRGDLRWRMAIPKDGWLPYDGLFPGLISWSGAAHPAQRLIDRGVRLSALTLQHPQAFELGQALARVGVRPDTGPRLEVRRGPVAITARLQTPTGARSLA